MSHSNSKSNNNSNRPLPRIDMMVSLKVNNLTYRTTTEDLRRVFERCGEVGDIYIPRDRYTRESWGFAFAVWDAEGALDAMDGSMLDGRDLRVQMARYVRLRRNGRGSGGGGGGGRRRSRHSRSPRRRSSSPWPNPSYSPRSRSRAATSSSPVRRTKFLRNPARKSLSRSNSHNGGCSAYRSRSRSRT